MQDLTQQGRQAVEDVARRHGVGFDAALTLLRALAVGGGTQAQFSHPELGGMGQWSQGGMIMVGDMFNQGLKARVDGLCQDLAALLRGQPVFAAPPQSQSQSQSQSSGGFGASGVSLFIPGASSNSWWPAELGQPGSSGAQNSTRYAIFPSSRRLAISQGGQVTVYDTGDHHITGFSQQQGGDQSLTFTSQYGVVRVADLPVVSPGSRGAAPSQGAGPSQGMGQTQGSGHAQGSGQIQSSGHPHAAGGSGPKVQAQGSAVSDAVHQAAPQPVAPQPGPQVPSPVQALPGAVSAAAGDDPFAKLERLADLRQKGILTDEEFAAKKAEILSRL